MSKVFQMLGGSGGSIKLASIEITTPPTKTAYKAGEQFSTAGMVVKATYSNGATLIATGVSVEPSGGLEAGRTASRSATPRAAFPAPRRRPSPSPRRT